MKIGLFDFNAGKFKCSKRDGRKNYYISGNKYSGLRRIVSEITGNHEIRTCNRLDYKGFDIILISIISYYDYINIYNQIDDETNLVVGGPGLFNIVPLKNKISAAFLGRCDSGRINNVLKLKTDESLWIKESDPRFENKYSYSAASVESFYDKQIDFFEQQKIEKSVGCPKKCNFCAYSHWNKFIYLDSGNEYSSGFSFYEDFFQSLDWKKCLRGGVSALDGTTEETRLLINKPISIEAIEKKILQSNSITCHTSLRLKIYMMYGFHWENSSLFDNDIDLVSAAKKVDRFLKNKIIIRLHFSHFIPYPHTPFEDHPFNTINFRELLKDKPILYDGENIKIYSGNSTNQSPAGSMITTGIHRGDENFLKFVCSREFERSPVNSKIDLMYKNFPHLFAEYKKNAIKYIKTEYSLRQKY